MPAISKTVSTTQVNGSEAFVYTINAAFSDLTQPANAGSIVEVLPSKIQYILPPVGGQIQSITTTPVSGGTQISFNLGAVNAGTSLSFTFACTFGPGRTDNDSFTNQVSLVADGVTVAQATAPTVYLSLNENFTLQKLARPSNVVNPGDQVTLVLALINNGDPGATLTNITLTDVLPPQLLPVTTSAPVGMDIPINGYSDPSANGLTGSWSGSTMTFNLPSYSGPRYEVSFQVTVASSVTPGQTFVNTGNWTVGGTARASASLSMSIYSPSTSTFGLQKQGPRTTTLGGPVLYLSSNSIQNGVDLSNYVMEDILPSTVDIIGFRVSGGSGLKNYEVDIALASNPSLYVTVVQNITTGSYPFTDLTPFIPLGDRVAKIRITAPIYTAVGSTYILLLQGTLNNTATAGQTITNTLTASSGAISTTVACTTIVNGASDLNVAKVINSPQAAYYPLDDISFTITGQAINTITAYPILMDLLPSGLFYETDSEYFQFYDNGLGQTFDSRQPNFPVTLPTRDVIPNFAGTGSTLLRWSFTDFVLPFKGSLRVIFNAFVSVSPPSTFTNVAYEGMPGNNVEFVYNGVSDPLDLDGDGLTTTDSLSTVSVSGVILTSSSFALTKLVQGDMDLAFSSAGVTQQGGDISYRLQVTNNQPVSLRDIEIIDILPYVGDTGVILTSQARGSQFEVYATTEVTAQIVNLLGDPVDPNPDITVEYSTSNDPARFDESGNPIGTGAWTTTPPADVTTIRGVRVTTGDSVILTSYDRLIVSIGAKAPVGVPSGDIAYNSYGVRANQIVDDQLVPLLPTEPNKVSVTIGTSQLNAIGSFVWNDQNANGLYDSGEPGVNGVSVSLYSGTGDLVATTVTANDVNGNPGYYLFANLPDGVYQVEFVPPAGTTLTQQVVQANGSWPDPTTGLSPFVTISNGQQTLDVNAGLIFPPQPDPQPEPDPRQQAITDIIQSVALEQAALAHILNAEGEKLQKAVALDITPTELLAVNTSIKRTLNAIARLEMALISKMECFGTAL